MRTTDDRYLFAHDLLRAALDLQINPLRRRRLHDRAAAAYEAFGLAGRRPAAMAYHLLRGSDPARARTYAERAATRALATFAFADAEAHLRTAVELTREHGSAAELPPLLSRLGEALVNACFKSCTGLASAAMAASSPLVMGIRLINVLPNISAGE